MFELQFLGTAILAMSVYVYLSSHDYVRGTVNAYIGTSILAMAPCI